MIQGWENSDSTKNARVLNFDITNSIFLRVYFITRKWVYVVAQNTQN